MKGLSDLFESQITNRCFGIRNTTEFDNAIAVFANERGSVVQFEGTFITDANKRRRCGCCSRCCSCRCCSNTSSSRTVSKRPFIPVVVFGSVEGVTFFVANVLSARKELNIKAIIKRWAICAHILQERKVSKRVLSIWFLTLPPTRGTRWNTFIS